MTSTYDRVEDRTMTPKKFRKKPVEIEAAALADLDEGDTDGD